MPQIFSAFARISAIARDRPNSRSSGGRDSAALGLHLMEIFAGHSSQPNKLHIDSQSQLAWRPYTRAGMRINFFIFN